MSKRALRAGLAALLAAAVLSPVVGAKPPGLPVDVKVTCTPAENAGQPAQPPTHVRTVTPDGVEQIGIDFRAVSGIPLNVPIANTTFDFSAPSWGGSCEDGEAVCP